MFKLVVGLLAFTPMLVSKNLRTKRLQDAAEVPDATAPYMAALHVTYRANMDEKFRCGGSIITARAILTAAHCLKGLKTKQLRVVVGTDQLDSAGESYKIKKMVSHEKYVKDSNANDIAIMFTDKDIQFSDRVQPVELDDEPPKVGEELRVTGWGEIYEDGPLSNDLLELKVKVALCPNLDPPEDYEYLDNVICVKPGPGQGICSGDSGGPLVDLKGGKQVGIAVYGPTPCATEDPDLYTSVHAFLPWIKKTLLDNDHDSNDYDGNKSRDDNDKQNQQNTIIDGYNNFDDDNANDDNESRNDDNNEQDP